MKWLGKAYPRVDEVKPSEYSAALFLSALMLERYAGAV